MKNIKNLALVAVFFIVAFATNVHAQTYPKAGGYVNDFAGLMTREQDSTLNAELIGFEQRTTVEVAVVIVASLGGQTAEDYAIGIATAWGVGKKDKNNGIVFLIAPVERKMWIRTASGARATLTDDIAAQIRDESILPQFKAHNMTQGVIDGTHAIMQVWEPGTTYSNDDYVSATERSVRTNPGSWHSPLVYSDEEEEPFKWTDADATTLLYCIVGIGFIVLALMFIIPRVRRANARNHVLANIETLPDLFIEVERISKNEDVKEEYRTGIADQKKIFSKLSGLHAMSEGIDWIDADQKISLVIDLVEQLKKGMEDDIAYALKARTEGPELLKNMPDKIEAARKKLAEGKPSEDAAKHLKDAEAEYEKARNYQQSNSNINWLLLYMYLNSARSNTSLAETTHTTFNAPPVVSSSDDDSSRRSFGFGGLSGFGGGGGGFGSGGGFSSSGGGGGAGGSW